MRRLLFAAALAALTSGTMGCCHDHCWQPFKNCACTQGCGDVYWGDWCDYPPPCCDPCDNCGNWVGPSPYDDYLTAIHGGQPGAVYSEGEIYSDEPVYIGESAVKQAPRKQGRPTLANDREVIYQR